MLPSVATPKFVTQLPSTGQNISYRPFLVKEEKILLMALEGGDQKEIMNAVLEVVSNCLETDIDANSITTFDLEFLFLQLRGKSVGEVVELRVGHTDSECTHRQRVNINLDDVKVEGVVSEGKIMITDEIGIKLRYPNITDMDKINNALTNEDTASSFDVVAMCVEYIYDTENVYNEFTNKEINDWLEGLGQQQFAKIAQFFQNVPALRHEIKYTCDKCGEVERIKLEGLESFFTLL